MRDLEPVLVKQGNVQDALQVFTAVIPDIRERSAGFEKMVTLFPNPECMGFNAGEVFEVLDRK
jgi:hypothetical protein